MGVFDTIHFVCPFCRAALQVQSKGAGQPKLADYPCHRVPLDVAGYVLDDVIECECGKLLRVEAVPATVDLRLLVATEEG